MPRAELAVVVGVTLLLLGFAAGTYQPMASVDGASVSCQPAIDLGRLPFTEAEPRWRETARPPSAHERHEEAACGGATQPLRLLTWTALAGGGLVVLSGWTALREREGPPAAGAAIRRA